METTNPVDVCSHGHPLGSLDNCAACDFAAGWWVGVSCRFCRRYEAHVKNLTTYGHTTRCAGRIDRPTPEPRDLLDLLDLLTLGGAS